MPQTVQPIKFGECTKQGSLWTINLQRNQDNRHAIAHPTNRQDDKAPIHLTLAEYDMDRPTTTMENITLSQL